MFKSVEMRDSGCDGSVRLEAADALHEKDSFHEPMDEATQFLVA
jgi:hypothetical protein